MPLFAYTTNIPDPNNNPSVDQPNMRTNTNSIASIINVDHYGFGLNAGGLHRQVQMPNLGAIPAGLSADTGNIYSKLAQSTGASTESNLFFTPSQSTNEYRLTRPITAEFTEFGVFVQDPMSVSTFFGWTFLPGGLLFQYGVNSQAGNGTFTVNFPVAFGTNPGEGVYSINASVVCANSSQRLTVNSVNNTQFTYTTNTAAVSAVHWQVIGK